MLIHLLLLHINYLIPILSVISVLFRIPVFFFSCKLLILAILPQYISLTRSISPPSSFNPKYPFNVTSNNSQHHNITISHAYIFPPTLVAMNSPSLTTQEKKESRDILIHTFFVNQGVAGRIKGRGDAERGD